MPKGIYIRTRETKRILSLAHKGHLVSKKTRQKISEGNKGKQRTAKLRRQISEKLKGKPGKPHSEETKRQMSLAQKGHPVSEEQRRKISKKLKGRKLSKEHKKRIGKASRKRKHSKKARKKMSDAHIGKYLSEETKRKISKALTGRKAWNKGISPSAKSIIKMRKAQKLRWQNKEYKNKNLKVMFDNLNICPTKPEIKMTEILMTILPNKYRYVGDGSILIGYKNPDFININKQKKIIEVYGNYWHGKERTNRTKRQEENQRINHFAKYGYQTLIVWEHELNNIKQLKRKLIKFHTI